MFFEHKSLGSRPEPQPDRPPTRRLSLQEKTALMAIICYDVIVPLVALAKLFYQ
jgi:hypothetical protein